MEILNSIPPRITKLLTDSRRIVSADIMNGNTAFVALRTSVGDGHHFVRNLYQRGLRTFIVNTTEQFADLEEAIFILAPSNTLDLIIKEAAQRLQNTGVKQIVITGSHKKTTVKELLVKAFRLQGIKVARSPRTWNSAMGIALSIFECLSKNPEWMIIEAGIDAPNQAKRILPMLNPEIGIITPLSDEHDEAFENHGSKVAEKIALVKKAKKIVYVDSDSDLSHQMENVLNADVVRVDTIQDVIREITGSECPETDFSTKVEIREIPENGILVIDDFTNDLDSLALSVAMANERRCGKSMTVFLGDFEGSQSAARAIEKEYDISIVFFKNSDTEFIKTLRRKEFADKLILIKGRNQALITFFDEARHETSLKIDIDALRNNFNAYRSITNRNTGIIGMVKADAYGHGALEVAKTLQAAGAAYLAVAVIDEGVKLRQAGITMPIIVLNPITNRFEALIENNLEPAIFSLEEFHRVEKELESFSSCKINIHLKLDTGMHRVGFMPEQLDDLIHVLKKTKLLRVVSIFSHLATADDTEDHRYAINQLKAFEIMSAKVIDAIKYPVKRHILNTAGIENSALQCHYDLVRPGIGLYGISPINHSPSVRLRPVAELSTRIIAIRNCHKGDSVGYGGKNVLKRPSLIATLPIGYADGIDRRLGNGKICFYIGGFPCPTVGNICMDQLMIDITDAAAAGADINIGTEVEIFGKHQTISKIAEILDTIPYEVLTSISLRVRRTYHFR